ncbi:44707_t:CDS:1, partial [Gigaspora margarita]
MIKKISSLALYASLFLFVVSSVSVDKSPLLKRGRDDCTIAQANFLGFTNGLTIFFQRDYENFTSIFGFASGGFAPGYPYSFAIKDHNGTIIRNVTADLNTTIVNGEARYNGKVYDFDLYELLKNSGEISKRKLDKRQYGGASTFAAQGAGVDANAPI